MIEGQRSSGLNDRHVLKLYKKKSPFGAEQWRREAAYLSGVLSGCAGVPQLTKVCEFDKFLVLIEQPVGVPLPLFFASVVEDRRIAMLCDWGRLLVSTLTHIHKRGVLHNGAFAQNC